IGAALDRVGLTEKRDAVLSTLSAGGLQRASLGRALIHDPDLLLLDEPLARLDPKGRHEITESFRRLKEEGKTLVFSSHVLSDVEAVCDRIIVLDAGQVVAEGPLETFRASLEGIRRFTLRVDGGPDPRPLLLEQHAVAWVGGDADAAEFLLKGEEGEETRIVDRLVRGGVRIKHLGETGGGLEKGYIEILRRHQTQQE
ncbi:MAG: ATP-binding cassette domain-containing protein, partial [Planctomycetota bacterium]